MRKLIITIALAALAAVGLACSMGSPTAPGSEVPVPGETATGAHPARTVATITVSGTGSATITYSTGGNLGSQQHDYVLPWSLPINSGIYSVVAQRKGSDAKGTIRCAVLRPDGSNVTEPMESQGAFAVVTCAGSV